MSRLHLCEALLFYGGDVRRLRDPSVDLGDAGVQYSRVWHKP